jgi:SNF2 family DNA or RNA helicase
MRPILSKANKAIVVAPEGAATTYFPNAPKLPDGNLVVPHALRETLLLRHMGWQIPNPMLTYYDWPGGVQPFAAQRATCKLLTENQRAYVLNDMGTGKTKAALWAWDYLNREGFAKKMLVVAPLSTLRFTWGGECFRTLPNRKVIVLHGTKQERLEQLSQDADIYVINHDGVKVIESELFTRADIDTLVLDELAVYRNNSGRSKRMRKFARRFTWCWGMTGTPMPNEVIDVWGQCMIITPHTVPSSRNHCKGSLMVQVGTYKWVPRDGAVSKAFGMMQPSVRFSLDDVAELPPVIERFVDVDLSPGQFTTYETVRKELQAMVQDKTITAQNAGVAMGKLLQISGGWVYGENKAIIRMDAAPRVAALYELIEQAAHKVLVAIPYRHMLEGVSRILKLPEVNVEHAVVHGDTVDREQIFNLFQNSQKYKVLLCHPQCVSHGLTLTAADTVVWYLPIASLDIYDQFNARFRRVGQLHKQQIFHLQATPAERKLYSLLRTKEKLQDQLLDLFEEATAIAA